MTRSFSSFFRSTVALLAMLAVQAQAHFLWIEAVPTPEGTTLKAGFGEKGEWETQYAPTVEKTHYWFETPDGKTQDVAFKWDEKKECYIGSLPKDAGPVVYGKLKWGIFARDGVPASLLYYYPKVLLNEPAKWADLKPSSNTDVEIVLKLEGSVVKFQALAGGKPMPEAKVKFYTPDATDPDVVTADKDGKGEWKFDGPGLYSATVVDRRKVGGEHEGKKYVGEMHCASLVFQIPDTKTTASK